ncbi:fibronectin type III domain-containing protein [Spirosoma sp. SC4-14]|uniref:fibronectin type III domain-containing protein n=1 Tax=Spirosoma sp. SC4-14 TaxID=3128900 RepID=UPI0030D60149
MKTRLFILVCLLFCTVSVRAQSNTPSNLTGSAVAYNQINLSWSDNSTNETRFDIERNDFSGFIKIGEAAANVTSYQDKTVQANGSYMYRVRAVLATGTSRYSNEITVNTPTQPPGAPAGLTVSAQGNTSIKLSWNAGAGGTAANYLIERSFSGPGNGFTQVAVVAYSRTPSYTDNAVSGGTQYCYRVRAQNDGGTSGYSTTACQTTANLPSNLSNLKAQAVGASSITLSWTPFGKESGIGIERRTGQTGNWTNVASTLGDNGSYTDNGLAESTEYCYRISQSGHDYSTVVCATTPSAGPNAPARLTAQAVSSSQINLQWADVSDNETGFTIETSSNGNDPWIKIANIGANTTAYAHTGLPANTRYFYRIRAFNDASVSGYSNVANATTQAPPITIPGSPSNLAATAASFSQINLTWSDNADNETGFELERSTTGADSWSKLADLSANTTTFTDPGLQPRSRYYYRIRAKNSAGNSAYSNSADATTPDLPPGTPTRLTATATSPDQINLVWVDLADNETGFQLEQSTDNRNWAGIADLPANSTSFQKTGLMPSTHYYYRVRAMNAVGVSDFSNVAEATTQDKPLTPPLAPDRLSATAVSATQINLVWSDLSDNESSFDIERSADGITWAKLADAAANVTVYQNSGLTPNTRYYYRIRAINVAGQSAYSATADAITPDVPPVAPAQLMVVPTSASEIRISWADQSGNETSFELERSNSAGSVFAKLADLPANSTSYEDRGLTPATAYCYRVRAKNAIGESDYSTVTCVTTPDLPPTAPNRLIAKPVSAMQINLAWADNADNETGFELERSNSAGGVFAKLADLPANSTNYEDRELNDNTAYCYRIRAKNSVGASAYTDVVCATTPLAPPPSPTNLMAQTQDYDQVKLSFSPLSANAVTVSIERSTEPNAGFMEINQQPATQTTYTDKGLQEFTTYYYRIRAINSAGNSAYSNVASARINEVIIAIEDELDAHTTLYMSERTLHISTDWHTAMQATIQFTTATGQVLFTEERRVNLAGTWHYVLDRYPAGSYIIAMVANNRLFSKRILLP